MQWVARAHVALYVGLEMLMYELIFSEIIIHVSFTTVLVLAQVSGYVVLASISFSYSLHFERSSY
jgi:hypothetical protein